MFLKLLLIVCAVLFLSGCSDIVETYRGPQGHCQYDTYEDGSPVRCFDNDGKEICSYHYTYKEDGHWC